MSCKERENKEEAVAACWSERKKGVGGKKKKKEAQMGKSIRCVRNGLNGLHFLTGHQKVFLHPKSLY